MSDYQIVRRLLLAEQRRREGACRYRPMERGQAMQEIVGGLAALERLRVRAEWNGIGKFWQDKFDK